jgi:class 3 adenylate cyclase/DNA-binding NarL/FixJ family response regulator
VRALLARQDDIEIVGEAEDYGGLVEGADAAAPQVIVTDIRMPPNFSREGIEAAKEVRKRHPGTGIVVLSQFDDPEYAVALLSEGSAGYGYLLKDRIAEGDQLIEAVRAVAGGGTALDPTIVDKLVQPVAGDGELTAAEEELLTAVAEGRPIKAIAAAQGTTPEAVAHSVDALFLKIAESASTGTASSLRRLRSLHQAIVEREEQGETLSRLLPTGLAEALRTRGAKIGETEELTVTVLMSDVRGYSGIAERTPPTALAAQLNQHRAEMNQAILSEHGTVMQYIGDAVMAVFGAPIPIDDHADRAVSAAHSMHDAQAELDRRWADEGLDAFELGIGLSTGPVAAALLGSEERLEYTVVGDTVNLSQRLQDLARPGGTTVLSDATVRCLPAVPPRAEAMPDQFVKGRSTPIAAWRVPPGRG